MNPFLAFCGHQIAGMGIIIDPGPYLR